MLESLLLPMLAGVAAGLAGALLFILLYTRNQRRSATGILAVARAEAERLRAEGPRDAEAAEADLLLSAKMETLKLREDLDREILRRREEWDRLERRAEERARAQERKLEEIDARERGAAHREEALTQRELSLRSREGEADRLAQEQRVKLERIAGLTAEDARREILQRIEDEARGQAAALVRDIKEQARRTADRDARRIISIAIQRLARRAHRREHRRRRGAAQRRDEGPDHRPRGPEHPRLRDRHRRGRHHRRHARHGRSSPASIRSGARWPAGRSRRSSWTAASIPAASRRSWSSPEGARDPAGRAGRAGGVRHRRSRAPPRDDQAHRPDALPHLLWPEHPATTPRKWPGWPA